MATPDFDDHPLRGALVALLNVPEVATADLVRIAGGTPPPDLEPLARPAAAFVTLESEKEYDLWIPATFLRERGLVISLVSPANLHSWLPVPDLPGFLTHLRDDEPDYVAFLPTEGPDSFVPVPSRQPPTPVDLSPIPI